MRYEHDHGCPTPDELEESRTLGKRGLLIVTGILASLIVAGVLGWLDAKGATENVYWRVDLNQGTTIIAYGQGATEQAAWDDCFRLQATARAMTAAETRKLAVAAITSSAVRWCKNPIRYATVKPDAAGQVTLRWEHVTTPGVAGFRIVHGTSPGALVQTVQIPNPAIRTYTLPGLPTGQRYFAVKAYDSTGVESDLSNIDSKVVL